MTFISRDAAFSTSIPALSDLSLGKVHETWKAFWGPTIKSSEIRFLVETTPRLSGRILKDIIRKASSIRAARLNAGHRPRRADPSTIERFLGQPAEHIIYSVGLVLHAQVIRNALADANAPELLRQLDRDAIKYALTMLDIAPPLEHVEPQNVTASLVPAGFGATLHWVLQFEEELALRLLLHLPMPEGSELDLAPEDSLDPIMTAVLRKGVLA